MRKCLLALTALLLSFTAIAETDFELRFPANPPRYLRQIPLGVITQRDLLDQLGIPQAKAEIDGETRWQYDQPNPKVKIAMTYVLVNGVVVDVTYAATGCGWKCPYNGMSARTEQLSR